MFGNQSRRKKRFSRCLGILEMVEINLKKTKQNLKTPVWMHDIITHTLHFKLILLHRDLIYTLFFHLRV